MKVLYIGKYPPIEGGTASAAYWRIEALEKQGISFQIVTCITDGSEFLIDSLVHAKNIHVLHKKVQWHIPYSQLYAEQLISKSLELATVEHFDLIEGCYLFPYGFAAYIVAGILKKPFFLRHAGSDLHRLVETGTLDTLTRIMAEKAALIVTYPDCIKRWHSIGVSSNLHLSSRYTPNPIYFTDNGRHTKAVFLGKITEKWDRSQLKYYYQYLKNSGYRDSIHVYSNPATVNNFSAYFKEKKYEVVGHPFVMPGHVPSILRDTKYLLLSAIPQGIPEESNLFKEGLMSGCTPVCIKKISCSSDRMDYKVYLQSQLDIYQEAVRRIAEPAF